ncbi:MAG: sulfite exporter TauE/SafE family protein [Actinomycetota bacterium]
MTLADAIIAIAIGFAAGVLSGLFGVGGGIAMTPAMDALLPVTSIAAIATPLPVIFPTSITGAITYAKAGQVDRRAAVWMAPTGLVGAAVGALATEWLDPALLLLVTAALLGWQSIGIIRGSERSPVDPDVGEPAIRPGVFATIGLVAGVMSGLLGIGGGLVMVPLLAGWCRMPLKRALGTSLLTIPALVIPGTIVHALLGNIDWWAALFLVIGAVPGARIGAKLALGSGERSLRRVVGSGMLAIAILYAALQLSALTN